MATQNDNGFQSFVTAEPIEAFRIVRLSSTTDHTVTYADAGEKGIGVSQAEAVSTGDPVTVKLWNAGGTFKITASAAAATRNAVVYSAADGKVSNTVSGAVVGQQLDTASGNGAIIEVALLNGGEVDDIAALASIDDDAGGTTGGTEQFSWSALTASAIDDDAGGTNGGTEQLTWTAVTASAIDDDCGGTNSGTEQLVALKMTAGTANFTAPIKNNFAVLADELNELRTNVVNMETKVKNNFAVLADEVNEIRTNLLAWQTAIKNNFKVTSNRINAIITAAGGAST